MVRAGVTLSIVVRSAMLVTPALVWAGMTARTAMVVKPVSEAGAQTSTTRQLYTARRKAEML